MFNQILQQSGILDDGNATATKQTFLNDYEDDYDNEGYYDHDHYAD